VHPGENVEGVGAATGFAFDRAGAIDETPEPDSATLALIRGPVRAAIAEVYPRFAAGLEPPAG
jgi:glutaconate CoA-transferase subunit B